MSQPQNTSLCRLLTCLLFAIILMVMLGCASTATQIGPFAQSVNTVIEEARLGYDQINESTISRCIYSVAADPKQFPDDATFALLLDNDKNLAPRLAAMSQLQSYASALGELSSADYRPTIDKAAANVYGSLTAMKSTYANTSGKELPISDKDLAIIGTAVDAIGTTIIEAKRRIAIRKIVTVADPAVQKIAALLKGDLPGYGPFVRANLSTIETEMIKAYQNEAAKLAFNSRVTRIEAIRKQHEAVLAAEPFFTKLGAVSGQIGKTHSVLAEAAEKDDFSIPGLTREIGELADYAKSFQEFNKRLTANP